MYIEKIKSPADLKKLDLKALQTVADETRQAVLNRVSKHGGHVGPNLGFVEATVALHYVFDAPKDKFVFDVSHQSYPHKVLTGRAAGFLGNVDDMNAISGYSSPTECPEYDNFEVGHTSTSISLATGLQKARDIKGTHENIIAIIGDGSLSGGEAFEGLDEASELDTGIIIVVTRCLSPRIMAEYIRTCVPCARVMALVSTTGSRLGDLSTSTWKKATTSRSS